MGATEFCASFPNIEALCFPYTLDQAKLHFSIIGQVNKYITHTRPACCQTKSMFLEVERIYISLILNNGPMPPCCASILLLMLEFSFIFKCHN